MNFAELSERDTKSSGGVPAILSQRDKSPVVLHLTDDLQAQAAERRMQLDRAFVYVIEAIGLRRFKIGKSVNFKKRFPSYRTECPVHCRPILVAVVPKERLKDIENALHDHFGHARKKGEWFDLSDDELDHLPEVIAIVAKRYIEQQRRHIRKVPRARPSPQSIKWRQEMERELWRQKQAAAVPTDELILDRLLDAQQRGERIDARDIAKSIDRRPQVVHEYIREMILAGQLAIVEPRRNPDDGSIWFDAYRYACIALPDESCDWEETNCGHEILVSEPLGEFVPEFFGRTKPGP